MAFSNHVTQDAPRRAALAATTRSRRAPRTLAVALHDIEPATYDRCALIRDWLTDHGVERVTLLVIPARDLHPLSDRRPEMAAWLRECELRGDAVAQHGFRHVNSVRAGRRSRLRGDGAEFVGLGVEDTGRAVDAGHRVLKLAGVDPHGFVAPAYAYTHALREVVGTRFDWWAGLLGLHGRADGDRRRLGPPLRPLPPALLALGGLAAGRTLRLDLHPTDLARPSRMLALESLLLRSSGRAAITYDELAGGAA